jgi:hypothetical protein
MALASRFGYLNLSRHVVGILWTSDQLVVQASTDTGLHNIQTQRQTSMPRAEFEPAIRATKRRRRSLRARGHRDRQLNLVRKDTWEVG